VSRASARQWARSRRARHVRSQLGPGIGKDASIITVTRFQCAVRVESLPRLVCTIAAEDLAVTCADVPTGTRRRRPVAPRFASFRVQKARQARLGSETCPGSHAHPVVHSARYGYAQVCSPVALTRTAPDTKRYSPSPPRHRPRSLSVSGHTRYLPGRWSTSARRWIDSGRGAQSLCRHDAAYSICNLPGSH
jgi:hypothetical protein